MLLEKLEALTPDIRPGTGQSLDQLPQDRSVGRLNNLPQATRRFIFLQTLSHPRTTETWPWFLRVGLTLISTSWPRAVRKSISRSTEKLPARLRIRADTWGCLMPRISPACACVSPRFFIMR